jgi:hypothetical protein
MMQSAKDEYTPSQCRAIDVGLSPDKGGKRYGPFTIDEAVTFLKAELQARRKKASKAHERFEGR